MLSEAESKVKQHKNIEKSIRTINSHDRDQSEDENT